ncbi:MAG: YoaP domain-containing protein, partial [Oscillospiraceae bacterium]
GYANQLLENCITDAKAKGKYGITVLSSKKKMPFLSDPKYLKYKSFVVADTADPYYELLYLPFYENAPVPKFKECAKYGKAPENGIVLYYSNQCPHTDKYAPMIKEVAQQHGAAVVLHKIETTEQAQNAFAPFTTYSFFYNGKFVTNEILSDKKFEKFLSEHGF